MVLEKRYNSLNAWLKNIFGERVFKVSLDASLSCPNRDGTFGVTGCAYCNLDSLFPATAPDGSACNMSIEAQLKEGVEYMAKRHHAKKFISYFQSGSNTHAPATKLRPVFAAALNHDDVVGLAVSTRPDCIEDEHIELFRELSLKTKVLWVELGLQSAHDSTLGIIERGHDVACFTNALRRLQSAGIKVCAHVILGLPGENHQMMMETADYLTREKVWGVKIHNLHILKGTKFAGLYKAGKINIPTLEEYASWVADFLERLSPEIIIHRVNSHSPRSLTIAPEWSVNKLDIFNAVDRELEKRGSGQGG